MNNIHRAWPECVSGWTVSWPHFAQNMTLKIPQTLPQAAHRVNPDLLSNLGMSRMITNRTDSSKGFKVLMKLSINPSVCFQKNQIKVSRDKISLLPGKSSCINSHASKAGYNNRIRHVCPDNYRVTVAKVHAFLLHYKHNKTMHKERQRNSSLPAGLLKPQLLWLHFFSPFSSFALADVDYDVV